MYNSNVFFSNYYNNDTYVYPTIGRGECISGVENILTISDLLNMISTEYNCSNKSKIIIKSLILDLDNITYSLDMCIPLFKETPNGKLINRYNYNSHSLSFMCNVGELRRIFINNNNEPLIRNYRGESDNKNIVINSDFFKEANRTNFYNYYVKSMSSNLIIKNTEISNLVDIYLAYYKDGGYYYYNYDNNYDIMRKNKSLILTFNKSTIYEFRLHMDMSLGGKGLMSDNRRHWLLTIWTGPDDYLRFVYPYSNKYLMDYFYPNNTTINDYPNLYFNIAPYIIYIYNMPIHKDSKTEAMPTKFDLRMYGSFDIKCSGYIINR